MELRYDFHLHSCLSPCGGEDMTPYNIVMMATVLELDIIALTDHNATGNCGSAIKAGKEAGILVLAGMELTTVEEIHMVCLFPDLASAAAFEKEAIASANIIKNKPEIFGPQIYMDSGEKVLGYEERLLINATGISIDNANNICGQYGGACYPAHIDRKANGLISNFGMFDKSMGFSVVEIADQSKREELENRFPDLKTTEILYSSDSHWLENMAIFDHKTINLDRVSPNAVIDYIKAGSQMGLPISDHYV